MTRVLWLVMVISAVQCSPMSRDELEDFSNFLLKTSSLDLHVKKGADPDDAFDEDEVASDHAWEESGKFEGDLILNDRQRRLIVENVEGLSRNGLTDSTKKWPNNEVIYFIQKEHFSSGQVQAIQDGIDDLAQASCVKFRPYRKGDRDAVVIQGSRRGCFSQVGYQGGYQVLNLSGRHPVGRGCFRHGTVVHELLHSLGFYHMQSSPDRDDYINVIWANIVQPARHNFRKYNSFSVSDFGVGYDYDSVLHYSRRAFSANGQDTLVPKKNGAEIGQRVGLSDKDTQKLNKMYCDADNDQALADENATQKPKNKKKKPKNQPFDGHGIGYHQGKTVVIKLPAAEPYKLSKAIVPSTHVFDFSKTPQIVSTPEAGGYRFGKEVTYLYKPTISLNSEVITENPSNYYVNPTLVNNVQKHYLLTDDKLESAKEDKKDKSSHSIKKSPEVKPKYVPVDEHDEDLKEAFHRLTAIVKQHVYPQNHDYGHKINKDYSTFLTTPLKLKQPNHSQDSINDNFNQSVSYSAPSHLLLVDVKQNQQEPNNNSNNKYSNNQVEDRMDTFYGVSLPTKKPYSSNEQTETPHYATLEYLQDRHDFSNIYSPIISKGGINNKHIEESPHKNVKYNHGSIKIIPYDHGFYTDNVQNYGKSNPTDVSKDGLDNKKENIDKYELDETSTEEPSVSIHKKLDDGIDSSYRTMLPTKKPYSSYEQTHTPTYATLEYLKDRHDISSLYTPKKPTDEKRTEPYTVIGRELPPTKSDGYNKDSYTQHSANYDQDSYADYIQLNRKNNMEETKDRITDIANNKDNDNENSPKSLNKPQVKTETVNRDEDFYTDYGSKENNERLTDDYKYNDDKKERTAINHHDEGYDDPNYFTQYKTEDSSLAEVPQYDNDEENIKESPKKNKSKHEIVKYYPDYYSSYEKEYNSRISNDNKNSKESPKSSTEDLYKSSHSIPDISHEDEYLGTHKDDYR